MAHSRVLSLSCGVWESVCLGLIAEVGVKGL